MPRLVMSACVLAAVLTCAVPGRAQPGMGFSLGQGIWVDDGVELSPLNAEAMLYYSFAVVRVDLGFLFNLEKFDVDDAELMVIRPGARLTIPGLFYVRGAIPVEVLDDFSYGFLLGLGRNLVNLAALRLFAEVDATFMEEVSFTGAVPIEVRLGLEVGF